MAPPPCWVTPSHHSLHRSQEPSVLQKPPVHQLMGGPLHSLAGQPLTHTSVPALTNWLTDIKYVREQAQEAIKRAQDLTKKGGNHFTPYHVRDKVWLDTKNLTATHPTAKLALKHYSSLLITGVISHVSYWLALPQRWCIC